jgi:uracil-DNA glycosylase
MEDHTDKSILFQGISDEWLDFLDNELLDNILNKLKNEKGGIVPPANKIFEFARLTPLDKIKIVIVGQDPYPKSGDAHGLAFSCLTNIPGSLRNMYKCLLYNKLITKLPTSGNLSYWATQGVLLLNCAFTTVIGHSNEHKLLWNLYTDDLINRLSNNKSIFNNIKFRPIFLLWGNFAKKKRPLLNNNCKIFDWSHPSPLAQSNHSFITCDNFDKANELLKQVGLIDWNQSESYSIVEEAFLMNNRKTVAFTDGSCNPNRRCPEAIAGYAAIFALGVFKDTILYGNIKNNIVYASNQRGEGFAIYRVLQYLLKKIDSWDECCIVSDSDFWIKMIENYMPNWERQNIEFTEKKNSDLTTPMWNLFKLLTIEHMKTIEFRHVKSHNKSGWAAYNKDSYEYFCYHNNNYVDELCSHARKSLNPGVYLTDIVEYDED